MSIESLIASGEYLPESTCIPPWMHLPLSSSYQILEDNKCIPIDDYWSNMFEEYTNNSYQKPNDHKYYEYLKNANLGTYTKLDKLKYLDLDVCYYRSKLGIDMIFFIDNSLFDNNPKILGYLFPYDIFTEQSISSEESYVKFINELFDKTFNDQLFNDQQMILFNNEQINLYNDELFNDQQMNRFNDEQMDQFNYKQDKHLILISNVFSIIFEDVTNKYIANKESNLIQRDFSDGIFTGNPDKIIPGEHYKVIIEGGGSVRAYYYKSLSGIEMLIFQLSQNLTSFTGYEFPHYKFRDYDEDNERCKEIGRNW